MNPGELNTKIVIQEKTDGTGDNDFSTEQWNPWKTVWAKKQGLSGRIFYQAAAVQAETDVIFTIRYLKDIKSDMQIVDSTNTYKIKSILDKDSKRKYWTITAGVITNGS